METRKANIIYTKPGGTAGKGSHSNRITLPTSWVKEMGVTQEDRTVRITYTDGRITIEKEPKGGVEENEAPKREI